VLYHAGQRDNPSAAATALHVLRAVDGLVDGGVLVASSPGEPDLPAADLSHHKDPGRSGAADQSGGPSADDPQAPGGHEDPAEGRGRRRHGRAQLGSPDVVHEVASTVCVDGAVGRGPTALVTV